MLVILKLLPLARKVSASVRRCSSSSGEAAASMMAPVIVVWKGEWVEGRVSGEVR